MQSQQPDDHKNLMLAVVLSLAVLMTWQLFFSPPPPPPPPEPTTTEAGANPGTLAAPGQTTAASGTTAAPAASGQGGLLGAAAPQGPRLKIETDALIGSISLTGGRIDDLKLVRYNEKVDPKSPNVALLSPLGTAKPYFAEHGWNVPQGSTHKVPGPNTVWNAPQGETLSAGETVNLTWDNGAGLLFTRKITLDADYMFRIEDEVENKTGNDIVLYPFARIYRYGKPKIEGFFIQHEGLIGWLGEERLQELGYDEVKEPGASLKKANTLGGWLGFTDKYWATALMPPQDQAFTANMSYLSDRRRDIYYADYVMDSGVAIAPGQTGKSMSHLFAGAKKVELINAYEEEYGVLQFNYLVDWGWFYFITKPLYYLLHWFHGIFGNFGLAILGVTVVVKLIFFPLANKAYESMAKMKALQPEMEKLRERFKEDKSRQQQELMKLYQEQKINPLAGCLPILLQIPVFFALYKVLFVAIDMRHAPFFGWVTDLSAPDPTSLFNLFGLLPYTVPDFLLVGVWPLIMGITMWLQMQLNPPQPDPTQQMVFNWMPVLFTFLLATFPAGLVIYWAWNNVLSLAQQWYIMKKQGTEVPLVDNIKKTFASLTNLMPGKKEKDDQSGA